MPPIPNEARKSAMRSARRERLLLLLSSVGEAYLGQLSRMLGTNTWTVRCLLYGRPPYYAVELSLIPLGLVRERPTTRGRAFEITSQGKRLARSIASRKARVAISRSAPQPPGKAQPAAPRVETTEATFTWRVG